MNTNRPTDLITVTEARRLLNVSAVKMSQLIRDGVVPHYPNPLDKRVKLVSRRDIVSLKPGRVEAA